MRLRTLLLLGATGVCATAATVWTTVGPARGSSTAQALEHTDPPAIAVARKPPPADVDHSHFTAGKTLMVEGRLGHQVLPADSDSETFLFVDVSATDAVARTPAPLDLAIVIDRSGSMAGKRMTNAMAAARTAIQRLRDGDIVSVLTFNTTVDVPIQTVVIDAASRARLARQLQAPVTTGNTCISCGIDSAMRLLAERDDMVSRILLLSDGEPTAGVRDLDGFGRIAENCRRMGASVTTIGVDVGFDEKVMSTLARSSNGHHFFAADPTALPMIFDQEMASLTRTVANHAELTVDLAPGVFAEHVFDRVTTGDGSQLVVPLGAFSAADHKTVLVRLRVPRGAPGERPVAAVRLRYDDLAEAKPGSCEGTLATRLSSDPSALTPLDALVSARVSASETAETLEQSNALFRAGKADEARAVLSQEKSKVERWHRSAADHAPMGRSGDVDRAFVQQQATLSGASAGFAARPSSPDAPATATPPAADKAGQRQIRENQADALKATE